MTSQYDARQGDKHYAPPRPKFAGRIFAWLLVATMLLSLYGEFFAQIYPSALATQLGEIAGAILAILAVFFLLRWKPQSDRPPSWKQSPIIQIPVMALIGFILGYLAFGVSLPSLYSLAFGVNATQKAVVTGWSVSRRHCSGPILEGHFFLMPTPCMAHSVPSGTVVTLYGRQSALGLAINSIGVSAP